MSTTSMSALRRSYAELATIGVSDVAFELF